MRCLKPSLGQFAFDLEVARQRTKQQLKASLRVKTLKYEVLMAYGGRCSCPGCHVDRIELLTLDHVAGGGHAHRRALANPGPGVALANARVATPVLYQWIKDHGYPAKYQAMCGSCNHAKGTKDKCPCAGEDH